jgi:hypothetical protein
MFGEMRYVQLYLIEIGVLRLVRAALGIPKSIDILEHIYSLSQDAQESAMDAIRRIESEAMKIQRPQPGLAELMEYLDRQKMRKAICTRNFE